MRSKIKTITFPVFSDYIIHVEITSDLKNSLQKYPQTKSIDLEDGTSALAVHDNTTGLSFIFLPHNASVGDIAHESWHVVRRMMKWLGIKVDSETCAYHLGYLTNQIFRFLRGGK